MPDAIKLVILLWLQWSPLFGLMAVCGLVLSALWLITAAIKADRRMQQMHLRAYLRELEERAARTGRRSQDGVDGDSGDQFKSNK